MKKTAIFIILLIVFLIKVDLSFAQDRRITQREFAVQLIKEMKLEYLLPLAPNDLNCVETLDTLGISPLGGWKPDEYLTTEDYTVIITKAIGKESLVHEKAVYVCQHNIAIINKRWQEYFDKNKSWPTLDELLVNRDYFPKGTPECPLGLRYKDKNNDHKVDVHYHPATLFFDKLRLP